ncbi:hypothetical protein MNEG_14915 [Monoraphidium neglectum]|uniref:Uncharacterized protein n=1 Tax=Monoraphidium neglectum TaxID=145388 RepID=A0A0D2LMM4_9CHLO|nr:hypothetical protein MNEG_14915 [Monoraphidium neglectum]KIY93049.1 hypothetical protein MNEG_14915 [Monoraphidium neglectum]|eukprot:XP_013892069.1 hypothetical protein MNEG_14915 [Monoraphidium neglectum]
MPPFAPPRVAVPPPAPQPPPGAIPGSPAPALVNPCSSRGPKGPPPEVSVWHSRERGYWMVEVRCKDRNKLCFDTVCTLADLRLDVYHATMDSENGVGSQLFYCRPRFGPPDAWDHDRAESLRALLSSAVQRCFPLGLKLLVYDGPEPPAPRPGGQLADLAAALRDWGLSITRCKVRESSSAGGAPGEGPSTHTFYLLAGDGQLPSRDVVRRACEAAGGELLEEHFALSSLAAAAAAAAAGAGPGAAQQAADGGGADEIGIGRRLRRGKFGFAFEPVGGGGGGGAAPGTPGGRRGAGPRAAPGPGGAWAPEGAGFEAGVSF